jgi:hypothetical protein
MSIYLKYKLKLKELNEKEKYLFKVESKGIRMRKNDKESEKVVFI